MNIKIVCCDDADLTMNFKEVKKTIDGLIAINAKLVATSSTWMNIADVQTIQVPHQRPGNHIRHFYLKVESWLDKMNSIVNLANGINGKIVIFCSVRYIIFL